MGCISNTEDEALCSRVEDTVRLCDKRNAPCFLGFLDLHEQAVVRRFLANVPPTFSWDMFGGYAEAERCILAICPSCMEAQDAPFPLYAVGFRYRPVRQLSHRDFLGTLLAAGIRRDKIGDILCGEGLSVVYIHQDVADYVCEQIDRIGGEGVTVLPEYSGELPLSRTYEEQRETVASPRLDAVVKALVHCSREDAAQWIRAEMVSVDHQPECSVSKNVKAPCTVSIRGKGRYLIDQIGPETKKGRLLLLARKCI